MKRVYNILLILTLSLAVLSGCKNIENPVFDETSSARIQKLIDEAYETLTSSEKGWYLEYVPGWDASYKNGGYWVWCKFDKNYTVTASTELLYQTGASGPEYTEATSAFEFIRGRGAVLTFNMFNDILHHWAIPSQPSPDGMQGDSEFTIVSVTNDKVTVKGIKTGTVMYFYRKTDDTTVKQDFDKVVNLLSNISAPAHVLEIKGAMTAQEVANLVAAETEAGHTPLEKNTGIAPQVTVRGRTITMNYSVNHGSNGGIELFKNVKLPMLPSRTDNSFTLTVPVEVMGEEITGFTFAYDGELGVLTSNDANQTIKMTQSFPPINKLFPEYSWIADPTAGGSGPSFMAAWNAATERNMALNGETLVPEVWYGSMQATLGNSAVGITFLSELGPDLWGAQYNFTFEAIDETENEISLVFTGNGALDSAYYRNTFQGLIDAYANHSPYYIEANSLTNPTVVVFTSKADSDFYFTCEKL